jgi:hypothetical protein
MELGRDSRRGRKTNFGNEFHFWVFNARQDGVINERK